MKNKRRFSWWLKLFFLLAGMVMGCNRAGNTNGPAAGPEAPVQLASEGGSKAVTLKIPHYPLRSARDLDVLLQQIGDARIVLLGEASHGTSEYYTWRAAITKRLMEEKGFDFMAVEGEWADSYRVNQFVQGPRKDSTAVVKLLEQYNRWPTWMWGNYEVASLVNWMNQFNQGRPAGKKVGFYGLDVYCLWESMTELMPYLQRSQPRAVEAARKAHQCFQPFSADAQQYALAVANAEANCRRHTSRLLKEIQALGAGAAGKNEAHFVAEQNALVAVNGERYYRAMISSNTESWNIRDRHMTQTLQRLLNFHGPDAKAVVWEHNTHVGDARYTDMAQSGLVNVGQLVRQAYGEDQVFIVGFGSYQGSVIAATRWGAPLEKMEVPAAPAGSWEQVLHQLSPENKILFSNDLRDDKQFRRRFDHRAIGVVYNPRTEHLGNYVPTVIPRRYDAFIFIDQTQALHPLGIPVKNEPPDLYPFGT